MNNPPRGAYGPDDDIVDYILGITFEIWEQGGVELIDRYYAADAIVYGLDGIVHGAQQMIDGTRAMLRAFPDRLLLGDDVICAGDGHRGYSSHRVLSPMTNSGDSAFGPATGRRVRIMNMADCVVENGIITREWLARDNLALVTQLGFDVDDAASHIAGNATDELHAWFSSEAERVTGCGREVAVPVPDEPEQFAQQVVANHWMRGDDAVVRAAYAPYAVLHRSPMNIVSGRGAIAGHFAGLRSAFEIAGASVDHVAVQPIGGQGLHIAARWAVAGCHTGEFLGHAETGRPVYIMGVTHWRMVGGRIAVEWTVFDSLAVLAQLV